MLLSNAVSRSLSSWGFSSKLCSAVTSPTASDHDNEVVDDNEEEGDGGDPPPPPSGSVVTANALTPRDKLSLSAARATIALMRHLSEKWDSCLEEGGSGTRVVPLLQTSFTLCRLLEAAAQCTGMGTEFDKVAEDAR